MADCIWYNIPDTPGEKKFYKDQYYKDLRYLMQKDQVSPSILYLRNKNIIFLENLFHNEKTKDFLNQVGLHIYLYEPLCYREINSDFNFGFYSEFFNSTSENKVYISDELESIKKYIIKNDLINVTVHTCDYRVEMFFSNYAKFINLVCDDIFLKHYIIFQTSNKRFNLKYKFLCLNWRYTNHRQLVVSYLVNNSVSKISWCFHQSFEDFKKMCEVNFDVFVEQHALLKKGFCYISKHSPFNVDIIHKKTDVHLSTYPEYIKENNINPTDINFKNILEKEYLQSFCIVVTETRFAQPTGNFSEKLLEAVRYKRPFILVAPPKTLEYFKSLGYKSFDEFWDESYDDVENHEDRMLKIFELIDSINNKSLLELRKILYKMKHILDHNFNNAVSRSMTKRVEKL